MDPLIVAVIGLVLMSLLMLLGMPIAFTMLAAGLLGNAYLLSVPAATHLAATNVWEQFSSYGLSVIPLFVLMGQFAYRAGTTERLYQAAYTWVGRMPGGLACTTVAASAGFSAICGSNSATTATMGTIAMPEMRRYGYDPALSSGAIAVGGTLGVVIPPSVVLIVIAVQTEQSLLRLSVIPPMTQLNTPYPSTAYLTGFLRSRGIPRCRRTWPWPWCCACSRRRPARCATHRGLPAKQRTPRVQAFERQFERYLATIEPAVAFLQGRDRPLAHRIAGRNFLPEGPRFEPLDAYIDEDGGDPLAWAFGALGVQDRARHLATLYLDDLADVLREAVDPRFEFVRYAESLAQSQPSFEPAGAGAGRAAQPGRRARCAN
jgi:hypothetical protein